MNEEQEQFWKILSEPYKKNCGNCIHWAEPASGGCNKGVYGECLRAFIHMNVLAGDMAMHDTNHWEWNGKDDV